MYNIHFVCIIHFMYVYFYMCYMKYISYVEYDMCFRCHKFMFMLHILHIQYYIYIHILICVFCKPPEGWAMLSDVCMLKSVLAKNIRCFPRKKGLLRRISFELHV